MTDTSHVGKDVDVDLLVITWMNEIYGVAPARAVSSVPEKIPDGGVLWIATVGGPSDWAQALIKIDVQSLVPGVLGAARPLAGIGHAAMGALGGSFVGDQFVNYVSCSSVPTRHYWSDSVDRMVATYKLDLPVLP